MSFTIDKYILILIMFCIIKVVIFQRLTVSRDIESQQRANATPSRTSCAEAKLTKGKEKVSGMKEQMTITPKILRERLGGYGGKRGSLTLSFPPSQSYNNITYYKLHAS